MGTLCNSLPNHVYFRLVFFFIAKPITIWDDYFKDSNIQSLAYMVDIPHSSSLKGVDMKANRYIFFYKSIQCKLLSKVLRPFCIKKILIFGLKLKGLLSATADCPRRLQLALGNHSPMVATQYPMVSKLQQHLSLICAQLW